MEKKMYSYVYTNTYGESVVGVVIADSQTEARQNLKNIYPDDPVSKFKIRSVKFDDDDSCEIFYG